MNSRVMRRRNHPIQFLDGFGEYHCGKSCFSISTKLPKVIRIIIEMDN